MIRHPNRGPAPRGAWPHNAREKLRCLRIPRARQVARRTAGAPSRALPARRVRAPRGPKFCPPCHLETRNKSFSLTYLRRARSWQLRPQTEREETSREGRAAWRQAPREPFQEDRARAFRRRAVGAGTRHDGREGRNVGSAGDPGASCRVAYVTLPLPPACALPFGRASRRARARARGTQGCGPYHIRRFAFAGRGG